MPRSTMQFLRSGDTLQTSILTWSAWNGRLLGTFGAASLHSDSLQMASSTPFDDPATPSLTHEYSAATSFLRNDVVTVGGTDPE